MEQQALHSFLHRYFTANECSIVEDSDGVMKVQLTEEIDEKLMNRPFYWHYVKRVNGRGIPMQVTFITNPERRGDKGEWLHFGSPRIHQMFQSLKDKGKVTRQYEQIDTVQQTSLNPWLILNVSLHYKGTQKRQDIVSLGLNLINGAIVPDCMERLSSVSLAPVINDFCFTLTPIIKIPSAFNRLENYLQNMITRQDHSWGEEALLQLQEEEKLLEYFFRNDVDEGTDEEEEAEQARREEAKERLKGEQEALRQRYEPTISLEVINGGVLYLSQNTTSRMLSNKR